MKILKAKYILICDENFTVLKDKSIAFDDKIKKTGNFKELLVLYPDAKIYDFGDDIVMPGLINSHTHLEFSANKTNLIYGDFIKWVESIVKNRDDLSKKAKGTIIKNAINSLVNSGVTTIGEISSFGASLKECVDSPLRVVYFNELLGANESVVEKNWDNFLKRFENSNKFKSDLFIPAASIHAPYSTHPNLTKRLCEFARKNKILISTHFLESNHENLWLRNGSGEFKKWLKNFSQNPEPFYSIKEFVENFEGIKTLFIHCVYLKEFEILDKKLHSIIHCAYSNRLLSKKSLNLKEVLKNDINLCIATDGLSSNISLNFFDELRANLLIHKDFDLQNLAKFLLLASTLNPAKALNLNLGSLEVDKIADIVVFKGFEVSDEKQIPLQLILNTKEAKNIFIKGEKIK